MSVKDDLIAARALIDTPEKLAATSAGGVLDAVCGMTGTRRREVAGLLASVSRWSDFDSHADTMALFDRAIEAAP